MKSRWQGLREVQASTISMVLVKVVIFDLDGTLIDSNWLHLRSWQIALKNLGLSVPDVLIVDSLGLKTADIARELLSSYDERSVTRLVEIKSGLFEDGWRRELKPRDGALEVLQMMRSRGVLSGVASSNSRERIVNTLKHFGMETLIDVIVGVDEVKAGKPDPAIVTSALRKLRVESDEAIYVGDSRYDIEAGKAAGVRTALVVQSIAAQSNLKAEPDYRIRSLLELSRIVWPDCN